MFPNTSPISMPIKKTLANTSCLLPWKMEEIPARLNYK